MAKASRESSALPAAFGAKLATPGAPSRPQEAATGQQEAAAPLASSRDRFVDDFGCASGCSHAHCGRRVQPQRSLITSGAYPAAAAEVAAAQPPDQAPPTPPGFVSIVGLTSPTASSPSRGGMLRNFRSSRGRCARGDAGSSSGSLHGGEGAAAAAQQVQSSMPAPQQLHQQPSAHLLPAPSTAAAAPAADLFGASGAIAEMLVAPAPQLAPQPAAGSPSAAATTLQPMCTQPISPPAVTPPSPDMSGGTAPAATAPSSSGGGFSQRQLSAFASASYSPFAEDRGSDDGEAEAGFSSAPTEGVLGLRQNSLISMSVRPLPADAWYAAAGDSSSPADEGPSGSGAQSPAAATGQAPGLSTRRGSAERPRSAEGPRSPPPVSRQRPRSARSLAAGLEHGHSTGSALGSPPPQV